MLMKSGKMSTGLSNNKESTRYYSDLQEKKVAEIINGKQQSNSGAGKFNKGDVLNKDISLLVECKTVTKEKESVSIKKEWLKKNKEERLLQHIENSCIAINFEPNGENYFVIEEKLMKYLVKKMYEN